MSLRDTLRGTGVALITPFTNQHEVDFVALGKMLDFVIHGGVEYVVVMGTTGETSTISKVEKLEVINFTYQKIKGIVPVVVGIGGNNTNELLKDLDYFPLDSAAAVLSVTPYYSKPSQEGLYQHYCTLSKESPKPIILYNVPGRTGCNITAKTTLKLANECDNILGIKEASGNMVQCMHILKDRPSEFLVTSGDDHLALPLIAAGMDGVISVAANCFPKDFSEMVRQALINEFSIAKGLHYKLLNGFDLLFAENNPAGVKAFLAELGVIENNLRLPLVPASDQLQIQVREFLAQLQ